jgi:hypothetical protein
MINFHCQRKRCIFDLLNKTPTQKKIEAVHQKYGVYPLQDGGEIGT